MAIYDYWHEGNRTVIIQALSVATWWQLSGRSELCFCSSWLMLLLWSAQALKSCPGTVLSAFLLLLLFLYNPCDRVRVWADNSGLSLAEAVVVYVHTITSYLTRVGYPVSAIEGVSWRVNSCIWDVFMQPRLYYCHDTLGHMVICCL